MHSQEIRALAKYESDIFLLVIEKTIEEAAAILKTYSESFRTCDSCLE